MRWIYAAIIALVLTGCNSAKSQLIGQWKGVQKQPASSPNLGDAIGNSMGNLIGSMARIEFNAEGQYKLSMAIGSQTGKYKLEGRKITLTPDPAPYPTQEIKMELSADGKTLSTEKQFESDPAVTFEKAQ